MDGKPLLIRGVRLLDPVIGTDMVGDLLLDEGKIKHAGAALEEIHIPTGSVIFDGQGMVACPGFIDLHCHLREPGFEHKETIASGTRAAARGGFTTVCAMPNTTPPVDSAGIVEFIQNRAGQEGVVRVLPIGCITRGREGKELAEMAELAQAGVVGFSDDGNSVEDSYLMRQALTYAGGLGLPVIDHCEDTALSAGGLMNEGWVSTRLGLHGYPAAAEETIVARDIVLAELTGGRLHLAHVTTAGAVELIRQAKAKGLSVTAEATPHHLTMWDEWVMGYGKRSYSEGSVATLAYDTRTKVNPPLRTRYDVEALVEALREGIIDIVATDHAPHALTDKEVTYQEAAFGISNLETALGSLMSLVHSGQLGLMTLIERLTHGPARILGGAFLDLATMRPGTVADVTLFDPQAEWTVDVNQFASNGRNTPLDGITLKGMVIATIYGGEMVYCNEVLKR